jgi:hypothetical protein
MTEHLSDFFTIERNVRRNMDVLQCRGRFHQRVAGVPQHIGR